MILQQGNRRIEFAIVSYQYDYQEPEYPEDPEAEPTDRHFDHDANWLVCEVKYSNAEIHGTWTDACLLTYELADMTEELSRIVEGSKDGYISDFMEPYLKVAAARMDDKIVIIFQFVYDIKDGIWWTRKITTSLSQEEAEEMVRDLKDLVRKYPER